MFLQRAVGFGLIVPFALASSAVATVRTVSFVHPRAAAVGPRLPGRAVRARSAASGCTSNYGTAGESFVAVAAAGGGETAPDIAGGQDSAVLAGNGNESCGTYSSIATGYFNRIDPAGDEDFIGEGEQNDVSGTASFVGGFKNVSTNTYTSFIGSGFANQETGSGEFIGAGDYEYAYAQNVTAGAALPAYGNQVSGTDSFIGAGDLDVVSGSGSFIGGGDYILASTKATSGGNQISANDSFVGAGDQNSIAANEAFIGSGAINSISSPATYASILGGQRNSASGEYSSVLGGFGNAASGSYSIVAGGDGDSAAGTLSFSAGYHADAAHAGSFVWSDYVSGSKAIKDSAVNQFVVRASGGTTVYSNEAATSGVKLTAGSGAWANLSDRNAKTSIVPIDDAAILAKVSSLPIDAWQYDAEKGVRHVGPMAQDFYAAFGTGVDDRHITSIDEDGVALAAIKALHAENRALRARLATSENARLVSEAGLRGELRRLEAVVASERR